jgi:penicillin-binding protein 2
MKPHLVKILEDGGTKQRTLTVPKESGRIPLKQENIDVIKHAMVGVMTDQSGTGYGPSATPATSPAARPAPPRWSA